MTIRVLLVDDVNDTGDTLETALDHLRAGKARYRIVLDVKGG